METLEEVFEYEEYLMKMKTIEINGWNITIFEKVEEENASEN